MNLLNKYKTATIVKIEDENYKIKNFYLDTLITANPGQYLMVWIPQMNEKPFGVVTNSPLMLSIANVGNFTNELHKLKVGDKITFRGSYGTFFKQKGTKIIMVAGGYGYVPLYFFASKIQNKKDITVIMGFRSKQEVAFVKKFEDLGCKVLIATNDGSIGKKGFTIDLLKEILENNVPDSIYSCGPAVMNTAVKTIAQKSNVFCQISSESYFKCGGMGLCGECAVDGVLVCKEGPII